MAEPKLVRARPKAINDLPEWRRCCRGMIEFRDSIGELIVDLSRVGKCAEWPCRFCGSLEPERIAAPVVGGQWDGKFVTLECVDLDEGVFDGRL